MKKFLAGAMRVSAFQGDDLIFTSNTMIDNTIELTAENVEVRAGQGNALQYNYFHSSGLSFNLTDAQFSLDYIALAVGRKPEKGDNLFTSEEVTLATLTGGGVGGIIEGTPTSFSSSGKLVGYVYYANGAMESTIFTQGADNKYQFAVVDGAVGDLVCIRYVAYFENADKLTIPANFIPSVVRLVGEAQLFSSDSENVRQSSQIGTVTIDIKSAQINPSVTLELSSSGVAQSPLSATALATEAAGCNASGIYATMTENLFVGNWYDNVRFLTTSPADIDLASAGATKTFTVWAIVEGRAPFQPNVKNIKAVAKDTSIATIAKNAVTNDFTVTAVANGNTVIDVSIVNDSGTDVKPNVVTNVEVDVSIV